MARKTSKKTADKKRKIKFRLEAPSAEKVFLMGDFNQSQANSHMMEQNGNGVWEKIAVLTPGRHEYKFLVDGNWEIDPYNNEVCWNFFGTHNSVIFVN